jgi:hypothetical protein
MGLRLGPVEVEPGHLSRLLRRDLRDDWFPDPLRSEDLLSGGYIERVLAENLREHHGAFVPSERAVFNIPKSNFTLRYGLETSLPERALYQAIVARLIGPYDPLMPWTVFSHRASKRGTDLFRLPVDSWKEFVGNVKSRLSPGSVLLSTDLANFYECIDLKVLNETFIDLVPELDISVDEKADVRAHLSLLFNCLSMWCFRKSGGLPQNRDASSFLANVYLLPVDRAMAQHGYTLFRYMDDIKVVCANRADARRALKLLSIELRHRGASVNAGKTEILDANDTAAVGRCLDSGEPAIQRLDSVWRTRSINPISRSFIELRQTTLRLIRDREVDSRPFRFCLGRLERLALCPELEVPPEYFHELTTAMIGVLSDHAAATADVCRYLAAVTTTAEDLQPIRQLLIDPERNFYTWQSYRLWLLLAGKGYREPALIDSAVGIVRAGRDTASRSGALRLIRFGGHVPKGGYDVPNGQDSKWPAPAPAVL